MRDDKKMDRLGVAISWQVPRRDRRTQRSGKMKAFLCILLLAILGVCAYGLYREFIQNGKSRGVFKNVRGNQRSERTGIGEHGRGGQ